MSKTKDTPAVVPLLCGTASGSETVRRLLARDYSNMSDEALDAALDEEENLVAELAGQRGGVALAADKLRVLVSRMRENQQHTSEAALGDQRDYELAASALIDLLSVVN